MRREAEVWKRFNDCLPASVWRRRIEDASGNLGTWDVCLMKGSWGGWLEMKHTETVGRKPKLRPGQYAFGLGLMGAGSVGFYVVGSGDGQVRLIRQDWDGEEDWRDYVQDQWVTMSEEVVLEILKKMGLFSL